MLTSFTALHRKLELSESAVLVADSEPGNKTQEELNIAFWAVIKDWVAYSSEYENVMWCDVMPCSVLDTYMLKEPAVLIFYPLDEGSKLLQTLVYVCCTSQHHILT